MPVTKKEACIHHLWTSSSPSFALAHYLLDLSLFRCQETNVRSSQHLSTFPGCFASHLAKRMYTS